MLAMRSLAPSGSAAREQTDADMTGLAVQRAATSEIRARRALPSWAIAAAIVYLDDERELEQGSASVWTARRAR
jgi:hypothetical protein